MAYVSIKLIKISFLNFFLAANLYIHYKGLTFRWKYAGLDKQTLQTKWQYLTTNKYCMTYKVKTSPKH